MWEQIQNVVRSLGLPEIAVLLLILGAGIAYFARSKGGGLRGSSPEPDSSV